MRQIERAFRILLLMAGTVVAAQDSKPILVPGSPGKAIQDATQAAADDLTHGRPKGGAVENVHSEQNTVDSVEVLSDGRGVNFSPYLRDLMAGVRSHWYRRIPVDARSKKGKLAIQFAVLPDGQIAALKLAESSGDVSLDRAAWEAITASNPFPALPSAFIGPNLVLRLRFYYNPDKDNLEGMSRETAGPIQHAVVVQSVADSHPPKYPKRARKEKVEGTVRLEALIAADGKVESVHAVEGSLVLGGAACDAVQKWTFHPAQRDGKPVEDRVRINVEFRLDGEEVRAQIVWPDPPPSSTP